MVFFGGVLAWAATEKGMLSRRLGDEVVSKTGVSWAYSSFGDRITYQDDRQRCVCTAPIQTTRGRVVPIAQPIKQGSYS